MAGIRIGTIMLGSVQAADNESIKTKFLMVGLPLLPLGSYYVGDEGYAVKVKLNWASVCAGYMRFYCGLGAVLGLILGLITWFQKIDPNPRMGMLLVVLSIISLVMFLISMLVLGKTDQSTLKDRRILKSLLGLGVHPAILPLKELNKLFAGLKQSLVEVGLPDNFEQLCDIDLEPDHAPVVYAAALYGQYAEPRKGWAEIANSLREHLT